MSRKQSLPKENTKNKKSHQYNKFTFLLLAHLRAFKHSITEIARKPLSCAITAIVIGITVAIPAILYLLLHNFQHLTGHWNNKPSVSIYLKSDVTENKINDLLTALKSQPNIAEIKYISPQEGLKDFNRYAEFSDVLSLLKDNPLPPVITLTFTQNIRDASSLDSLVNSLKTFPSVDQIKWDSQWIQRMHYILTIAKRLILTLTILLGTAVILVVSNTIRLHTQSHRQEMQVLKLVGASYSYIRRPYLYHGLLYGALGGFLACALIELVFSWILPPALLLLQTYNSMTQIETTSAMTGLAILTSTILLGLLGSWLAIRQQLDAQ
jgi:cell division transport system permease protein